MKNVKKTSIVLTDNHYNTPGTSLVAFQFQPYWNASLEARIRQSLVEHTSLDSKDVYLIDGFFSSSEGQEIREYSARAAFSRNSYGSPEAIEKGERPARSMNGKERWQFFSNPPQPILELYNLFGMVAHCLGAEVSTLPWELCDANRNGSPSVIGNFLDEASQESMELGKHRDCDPASKVPFGIPILYHQESEFHPSQFVNGDVGKPWLISVMLYATDEAFLPEYRLGTAFYNQIGEPALKADCLHMRLVIFEGDIIHSIEASKIPTPVKTWRVSYVFKLVLNPKQPNQSIKKMFSEWIGNF